MTRDWSEASEVASFVDRVRTFCDFVRSVLGGLRSVRAQRAGRWIALRRWPRHLQRPPRRPRALGWTLEDRGDLGVAIFFRDPLGKPRGRCTSRVAPRMSHAV